MLINQFTVDVNSSEKAINEGLEGTGEIIVTLAYTICLDSLLKLLSGDLTVLGQQKF